MLAWWATRLVNEQYKLTIFGEALVDICFWDLLSQCHFCFVVPGEGDVQYKRLMRLLLEPFEMQIGDTSEVLCNISFLSFFFYF